MAHAILFNNPTKAIWKDMCGDLQCIRQCGLVYSMYQTKVLFWKFPEPFLCSSAYAFLGSLSLISNNILQATTNDDTGFSNRTIYFTVTNLPKFGKLVGLQTDKATTEISSFTQQMVSVAILFSVISAMHIRAQDDE